MGTVGYDAMSDSWRVGGGVFTPKVELNSVCGPVDPNTALHGNTADNANSLIWNGIQNGTLYPTPISPIANPGWPPDSYPTGTVATLIFPRIEPNTKVKEQPLMRALYQVYLVDDTNDNIDGPYELIAVDETTAKLKAYTQHTKECDEMGSDPTALDNCTFVVHRLGDVKPKRQD